jgi:hypothetical protein
MIMHVSEAGVQAKQCDQRVLVRVATMTAASRGILWYLGNIVVPRQHCGT